MKYTSLQCMKAAEHLLIHTQLSDRQVQLRQQSVFTTSLDYRVQHAQIDTILISFRKMITENIHPTLGEWHPESFN